MELKKDYSQKDIAKDLKANFGAKYTIQGHNIYLKDLDKMDLDNVEKYLNKIKDFLGYKRIVKKEKENGKVLFFSVPFGIAINVN